MKRSFTLVFGVVLVGVIAYLVYVYRADFGLGGKNAAQGSAGGSQLGWQLVDRSADGFKVLLPPSPSETQVPAYTDRGVVEEVDMLEAQVDPESTYAVAWADNPPVERAAGEDPDKTLRMARDGALGRTQTSLVSESQGQGNGYISRDFEARNVEGGVLNARLILAGTRLYMLIAAFPDAGARRDEDVNRFFNSFTLTGAAPPSQ